MRQRWEQHFSGRVSNLTYTSAGRGRGRRSQGWSAPSSGPNNTLTGNLGALINRSRAAIRNDPWAASGLEKLVANIVIVGYQLEELAIPEISEVYKLNAPRRSDQPVCSRYLGGSFGGDVHLQQRF